MSHETKDCLLKSKLGKPPNVVENTQNNNSKQYSDPSTITTTPMQQPQTAPMFQPPTVAQSTNESKNF